VLYSQAVLTLGAQIEDPASFVTRLNDLLLALTTEPPAGSTPGSPPPAEPPAETTADAPPAAEPSAESTAEPPPA